jgi:hypothetical protein
MGALVAGNVGPQRRWTPSAQDLVDLGWQYHHWFPQQFEDEFDDLGIDVHQYTTLLPPELNQLLHQEGSNDAWDKWLGEAQENGYTADDAVEFLYELLQPYLQQLTDAGITGPNGLKAIVPYPGRFGRRV